MKTSTDSNQEGASGANTDQFLEQYKLYVEMADKLADRRARMNASFMVLNVLFIVLIGADQLMAIGARLGGGYATHFTRYGLCIMALAICGVWISMIRYYKQLNSAKFDVIQQLEARLPVSPYRSEWEVMQAKAGAESPYSLADREVVVVYAFAFFYVLLIVLTLTNGLITA